MYLIYIRIILLNLISALSFLLTRANTIYVYLLSLTYYVLDFYMHIFLHEQILK